MRDGSANVMLERLRGELRIVLHRYPRLCVPLAKRWGTTGVWITRETEFVIEGYPRSGNTFATAAFGLAKKGPHPFVGHHTHSPAQVLTAVRRGIPALVLIRRPEDAVLSWVIMQPRRSVGSAIREWIAFYAPILKHRNQVEIATFDDVTTDFGAVTRRVNQRFGTSFPVFEPTEENVAEALRVVERHAHRVRRPDEPLHRLIAAPSPERDVMKEGLRPQYLSSRHRKLRDRAERLYEEITR